MKQTDKIISIINASRLALELEITKKEAGELMRRDDFPSTKVGNNSFVIDRGLLEAWVRNNAKNVKGVNFMQGAFRRIDSV